jgi:hypothetical protein
MAPVSVSTPASVGIIGDWAHSVEKGGEEWSKALEAFGPCVGGLVWQVICSAWPILLVIRSFYDQR